MMTRGALLILVLAALFLAPNATSESLRTKENLRHETVVLPFSAPETSQLALVGYAPVADQENLGVAFLYDDPQTQRAVDYIELYDQMGDLLLVTWIDHFGVYRVAVDRGLLRDEHPSAEGVLVLVSDGLAL
jgi:hypothetical protein